MQKVGQAEVGGAERSQLRPRHSSVAHSAAAVSAVVRRRQDPSRTPRQPAAVVQGSLRPRHSPASTRRDRDEPVAAQRFAGAVAGRRPDAVPDRVVRGGGGELGRAPGRTHSARQTLDQEGRQVQPGAPSARTTARVAAVLLRQRSDRQQARGQERPVLGGPASRGTLDAAAPEH